MPDVMKENSRELLTMSFHDHFSGNSDRYAQYRPHYPAELIEFIVSNIKTREVAWDCATGNGQAAVLLSKYFRKVMATDASENQIKHAQKKENISYGIFPAEKTNLKEVSVDLTTVAAAIHWFKFDAFYDEVRRVSKNNGLLAVWTYDMMEISEPVDSVIWNFYTSIVGPYWPEGRKYVEQKYQTIPFPFREIKTPAFQINSRLNLEQLRGYLQTWSSVQEFIEKNSTNPIDRIETDLKAAWGNAIDRNVRWPLFLRIGLIEK
jgi:ubiquinone/menaquinone biosynthesis C-methylase UbiE